MTDLSIRSLERIEDYCEWLAEGADSRAALAMFLCGMRMSFVHPEWARAVLGPDNDYLRQHATEMVEACPLALEGDDD